MKHILSIIFSLFIIINPALSQSISEQLGAIKTDFNLYIDNHKLNITDQIIIKRGIFYHEYQKKNNDETNQSLGFSEGTETYHLEFIIYNPFNIKEGRYINYQQQILELYDENNKLLIRKRIPSISIYAYNYNLKSASINLKGIPLITLDHTHTIKILNQ